MFSDITALPLGSLLQSQQGTNPKEKRKIKNPEMLKKLMPRMPRKSEPKISTG